MKISQYIGNPNFKPNFYCVGIKPGDVILFTSDGVHDNLTTNQLIALIHQNKNLDAKSLSRLIVDQTYTASHKKGNIRAKADDMSAIVVKVDTEKQSVKIDTPKEIMPELPEKFTPKIDKTINVQRSSGKIESDWKIFQIQKDGSIIVHKYFGPGKDDYISKKVDFSLVERLNRQPKLEDIAKAENFGQLIFTLKYIPYIQGSIERYTNESLLKLIQDVRNRLEPINSITRAYGLRDTVARLLIQK